MKDDSNIGVGGAIIRLLNVYLRIKFAEERKSGRGEEAKQAEEAEGERDKLS